MIKAAYKSSLFWPSPQLLSLPITSSNYIVKIIQSLYDMQKVNIIWFVIYHLHYKDKLSNPTWSFIFAANNLHSIYSLDNFSMIAICIIKSGLVIKKRELLKTLLIFFLSLFSIFVFFFQLDTFQIYNYVKAVIQLDILQNMFGNSQIFNNIYSCGYVQI